MKYVFTIFITIFCAHSTIILPSDNSSLSLPCSQYLLQPEVLIGASIYLGFISYAITAYIYNKKINNLENTVYLYGNEIDRLEKVLKAKNLELVSTSDTVLESAHKREAELESAHKREADLQVKLDKSNSLIRSVTSDFILMRQTYYDQLEQLAAIQNKALSQAVSSNNQKVKDLEVQLIIKKQKLQKYRQKLRVNNIQVNSSDDDDSTDQAK